MPESALPSPDTESPVADPATRTFLEHRRLLFSVVYNLLGSVADAEEVLQETWLAWNSQQHRANSPEVGNPRAYLVRMAVNQALTRRAAISRRKETYVGPWLPEPLVEQPAPESGTEESALRTESVSMAVLVVLESLAPLERAVFVLHEVFGYAHTEIAVILDRKPDSIRQIARRARKHVQARRPRYQAEPKTQQKVTQRFIAAALGGDLTALMEILAPDVTLWADGGGKAPAAGGPVHGHEKVARLLAGFAYRPFEGVSMHYRQANGDPSILLYDGDAPWAVLVLDLTPERDRVQHIYSITNPEKLTHIESLSA